MDLKEMGERFNKARTEYSRHGFQSPYDVENTEGIGISNSTIYEIEKGKKKSGPSAEVVIKLAQHYGVSADYLLTLSKYPYKTPNAVDELGLSKEAVDSIHAIRNNTLSGILPERCFEALDQFLKSDLLPAFLAFFSHAQKTARNTREMLEKAIIEQDNPSNGSNPGYDTYSALLNQESYPFARYTVVQSFSEMIDNFCNAAEIDRLQKQLSKRIDENAAARIKRAEEVPNGEHSEN